MSSSARGHPEHWRCLVGDIGDVLRTNWLEMVSQQSLLPRWDSDRRHKSEVTQGRCGEWYTQEPGHWLQVVSWLMCDALHWSILGVHISEICS